MRSGEFQNRIDIQQAGSTRNEYGEVTVTWNTYSPAWAKIEPLTGREYFAAQQMQAVVDARITTRYMAGVSPQMKVVTSDSTYLIQAVINPEMANRYTVMMCRREAT